MILLCRLLVSAPVTGRATARHCQHPVLLSARHCQHPVTVCCFRRITWQAPVVAQAGGCYTTLCNLW
jgi:hypothetical protein